MSAPAPVIVVGAGIGGLAAAISLASHGVHVLVLERSSRAGGKIRQEWVQGQPIDAGPTVLTMRWVFDALFDRAGQSFDSYVRLRRAPRLARHFWPDGSRLDLTFDVDENADAIAELAGPRDADGYRRFAQHAEKVFGTVKEVFLEADRPNLASTLTALGRVGPAALWQVQGHRTLWSSLADYFQDARLQQLFGRYATYCGSSPFLSPATLNVISHVEREGVWLPEGGMASVAAACETLARRLGVHFVYDAEVRRVLTHHGAVRGVQLASGEQVDARAVLFNGDPAAIAAGLLGPEVRPAAALPRHRSLSAVTACTVTAVRGCDLDYHTVFFSDDYEREFIQLFHQGVAPSYPSVYVCAQDRSGIEPLPHGPERLFLLMNAPATGDSLPPTEFDTCRESMLETLRRCGWNLDLPSPSIITTPVQFAQRFPATGGSLYGPASHGMMSPLHRTAAACRIPGLFFAGGGAHPGAGVPMAATSGMLAARAVLRSLSSTRPSPSTDTDGGTSTRSATTEPPLSW